MTTETGHFVQITYHGPTNTRPSRYSVAWAGWPSEGRGRVRRYMPYTSERDDMANAAAQAFVDWLSAMPGDADPLRFRVTGLSLASMGDGAWSLHVKTTTDGRASKVTA